MVLRVIEDDTHTAVFNDPSKILDTEQQFKFDIEYDGKKHTVNGIIDLVIKLDDDTIEIVDYKTGRHKLSYNAAEKDIQLMLYYLAARTLYPEYKHHLVTIYYVQGGRKQLTPGFSDKTKEEIEQRIATIWRAIEHEVLPTRIADKADGSFSPNHVCKYLCNIEACKDIYPRFIDYINRGGDIDQLRKVEDLDGE